MIPTSILRQKTKVTQNKTNPVPPNATRTRFNNEYYSDEISEHRQDQPTPATISNLNNLNQNINNDFYGSLEVLPLFKIQYSYFLVCFSFI